MKFLPMDIVKLPDDSEAVVNSAHYISKDGRQMFSICGFVEDWDNRPLYYFDECELVHRHIFNNYKCDCGASEMGVGPEEGKLQ